MTLAAPAPLAEKHEIGDFDSGGSALDDWLKRRARANAIHGYYRLSSGALAAREAPGKTRRNMPDPIPMAVLGRLAVDLSFRRHGLGVAMLQDAVLRTAQAARILGIRGILVHALTDDAKAFYERFGFIASPTQPMTLVLSLKQTI